MVDRSYNPSTASIDDGIVPFPSHYNEQFSPRRNLSKAVVAIHHQLALAEREEGLIELGDTTRVVNRLIDVIAQQSAKIDKLVKRVRNVNKTINVEIYTLKGEIKRCHEREHNLSVEVRRLKSIEEELNELKSIKKRQSEKRSQGQLAKYENMRAK